MNRLILAAFVLFFGASAAHRPPRPAPSAELWAFTGPWDARSDSSLRVNAHHIDVAVTGWIGLDSGTSLPIIPTLFPDTIRLAHTVRRMAIVTSWHGARFHSSTIRTLGTDDARRARAAHMISAHAASMHYSGLVLDFEDMKRDELPLLLRVVKSIADSARAHGVSTIAVAVPASDSTAYPGRSLVAIADFIMPMLYDEHWSTSAPGAIASPDWVRSTLAGRIAEVGASRIIAAFPTYGYKWSLSQPHAPAEDVSFADAKREAAAANTKLERDPRTQTLHASKPGQWEIWVSDADLLAMLTRQARDAGVQRFALWRIGAEDPAVWRALGR